MARNRFKGKEKNVIVAVVVEANLVENKVEWILDTGISRNFVLTSDHDGL